MTFDDKDIAEMLWALRDLRGKLSPWYKRDRHWVAPLAEATADLERIIGFIEERTTETEVTGHEVQ